MSQGSLQQAGSRSVLKRVALTGTKIYLTLAAIQFLLGMLFGGALVLFGYDIAEVEALIRN